jgi:hypothetical protein
MTLETKGNLDLYSNTAINVHKAQVYAGEFIEGRRHGHGVVKIFKSVLNESNSSN